MSNEEFLRRKATKNEQVSVPPDGFYVCGCGASLWILVKNGDCVCAGCNRAQARIKVRELAPVDYRTAPETSALADMCAHGKAIGQMCQHCGDGDERTGVNRSVANPGE